MTLQEKFNEVADKIPFSKLGQEEQTLYGDIMDWCRDYFNAPKDSLLAYALIGYYYTQCEVEKRNKVDETYYQPEICVNDGINTNYYFPIELFSFEVFRSKEECEEWLEEYGYNVDNCIIHEYHNEDIEEHTYVE